MAAGEHGGHPAPLLRQSCVPDRVDTAMDHVKAPGGDPPIDRPGREPHFNQLPARYDAVLGHRQLG
jgi:hypothetical protein